MKSKNKISNINWMLVLIISFFEIAYIHYAVKQNLDIFFSSNPFRYLKLDIIIICFNLVFGLFILDFGSKKHKVKNILKSYVVDINYIFKNTYIFAQVIKCTLLCYIEPALKINFILLELLLFVVFYIVVSINKPKDYKEYKIKKLKKGIRKNNLNEHVILFEEDVEENKKVFVSTFDAYHTVDTKISDNYIYIDYKNELPKILERYPEKVRKDVKRKILENTVVYIKRASSNENGSKNENKNENKTKTNVNKQILEFRDYCLENNLNLKSNFLILAIDNLEKVQIPEKIEYLSSLKVCKTEKYIEYIEDLLEKEKKFNFEKKLQIKDKIVMALKWYFLKEENIFKNKKEKDMYIRRKLYIKCKNMYNNRFIGLDKKISKESDLFEMYKNAFCQESIHQSYMILLNYINMLHQMVSYYAYAKNNNSFDKEKIDLEIIEDNYSNYQKVLMKNLSSSDAIYSAINNKKEYKIQKDFKELIEVYLSNLLSRKIEGDTLTYSGANYLVKTIRDKIKAHGTISDEDSYLFWAVCYYLVEFFNEVFEVEDIESIVKNEVVYIKYKNDKEYTNMGKYIKMQDNGTKLISQGSRNKVVDISYLSGKFVRPVVKNTN